MQRKATIYIVDDEPQVLEAIAHLVEPTGAQIETFAQADDFLSDYRADGPGCLVLDVRMPGMSGLELQSRLAQAGRQIPTIIVTGHADIRMAVETMKSGAANFLEKPFRPQELFDEIQKALRADEEFWRIRDEEESLERKLASLKPGVREVLNHIIDGKTNEEIAEELGLSVRGVEARRAKAMKILRVDSKSKLLQLLRPTAARNTETAQESANS